jgi:hypothetical protein
VHHIVSKSTIIHTGTTLLVDHKYPYVPNTVPGKRVLRAVISFSYSTRSNFDVVKVWAGEKIRKRKRMRDFSKARLMFIERDTEAKDVL